MEKNTIVKKDRFGITKWNEHGATNIGSPSNKHEDPMINELAETRLNEFIKAELKNVDEEIYNEHIWELGHNGDEPNPHTANIAALARYRTKLYEIAFIYSLECSRS